MMTEHVETIEVCWPAGEGGRPGDVFFEIKGLLETRCSLTADYVDRKPKGDSSYIVIYEFDKDIGYLNYLEGNSPWLGFLWDWKEPRAAMIRDLNDAMKFFNRKTTWILKSRCEKCTVPVEVRRNTHCCEHCTPEHPA